MKMVEQDLCGVDLSSEHSYTVPSGHEQGEDNEKLQIGKEETRRVGALRFLVALVLLTSATVASLMVYLYISNSEQSEFQSQFQDDALKVLTALGTTIENTFTAVDSLVVNIVSFADATNQTFPFVVVPDFAVRAKKTRALSEAVVLNMYQLVSDEERLDWEAFTATHNGWVDDALDIQEADPAFTGPIVRNYTTVDVIHGYGEEESEYGTNRTGPYLPWWHSYPMVTKYPPYNWDLMSSTTVETDGGLSILESHLVEMGETYLIAEPDDIELQEENAIEADFYMDFLEPGENPLEPILDIYYPILANAHQKANFFYEDPQDLKESQMVGILATSIYWRDFIKNILPNGSNGIVAVFECDCNPTFSYMINGPEVYFVGTTDAHEPKYDHLAQRYRVADLAQLAIDKTSYSGIPMDHDKCPVVVTIYPSSAMEERFLTGDAILFAVIVALTFVFTSLIFVLYDFWVEHRQKVVLTSAQNSNAIVTQLFPSNVRDRMYKADGSDPEQAIKLMDGSGTSPSSTGAPIADLFEEATVIFADIVGFTSWSSTRSPTDVFLLLEALYGAFDKIALRRGVFKIETIGDSYVAVTGLPKPQKHHASIMCRFAWECLRELQRVTAELEETLGPGTRLLQLRIGLHSGPVTAGVLRGRKARFQLFGDTVNTASRMESTGKPMRIQVSQATADALAASGKSSWLHARPDVVHAKGKGDMRTYWLEIKDAHSTVSSVASMYDTDWSDEDSLDDPRLSNFQRTVVVEAFDKESILQGMDGYVDL